MNYQMTSLEEKVRDVYEQLGMFFPYQINMKYIADSLDVWISYHEEESRMSKFNGNYYILLNDQLSPQEEWQDFSHELGHVLKHVGNQHKLRLMFRKLQENQANNFMYHFCVPTFMLLNYEISNFINVNDGISFISKTFNVTEDFAKQRLIQFKYQLLQAISDKKHREFMDRLYPKAPPYSPETNAILDKLKMIQKQKEVRV